MERAPAKINLYLHVGGKRADGYHALASLVCFAEAGDALAFAPSPALSLSVEGPFAAALANDGDNLILKAARALADAAGVECGARIVLTKNLPVASGIGGGSADAAATLRGLTKLWNLGLDDARLHAIALALGSDVPVCLRSAPSVMEGRGEHLRAAGTLPPLPMLLVNPGVAVSTGAVFARLGRTTADPAPDVPALPPDPTSDGLLQVLKAARNDMEGPARAIAPAIGDVLDGLRAQGARLARMCGSGATCYGLFETDAAAQAAATSLAAIHPGWWLAPTRIAPAAIVR